MNVTTLAESVADMLVAFLAFLLWLTVVSLILRPFGLRLPLTPFSLPTNRSIFQDFTIPQFLIVAGVLYFGCGMFIMRTLPDYLKWKCWNGSPLSTENMVGEVLASLLAGVLFGFVIGLSLSGTRRGWFSAPVSVSRR
jgi:hypothetical protein